MGTVNFDTTVTKTVGIDKTVDLTVNKEVSSDVDVDGSLATAEASADAIDFDNVLAETDTFAQVSASGAFSFSESLAAGDNDEEPPLDVTEQINLVFVIDATGSTTVEWASIEPDRFAGFDPQQNAGPNTPPDSGSQGPNNAGDVIDAQIAAYKNLTNDLLADIAAETAAAAATGDALNVDLSISLVRLFDDGAELVTEVFDPQADAGAALFAALEDTGSSGNTNLSAGLDGGVANGGSGLNSGALDAFASIIDNPLDVDGAQNVLYYMSDADSLAINNDPALVDALAALDANVAGLTTEAWLVENTNGASPAASGFDQIGDQPGGFETLQTVADLTYDFDISSFIA